MRKIKSCTFCSGCKCDKIETFTYFRNSLSFQHRHEREHGHLRPPGNQDLIRAQQCRLSRLHLRQLDQRAGQLDRSVRLRSHQLPALQPSHEPRTQRTILQINWIFFWGDLNCGKWRCITYSKITFEVLLLSRKHFKYWGPNGVNWRRFC